MTTIALDASGMMAADTQESCGDLILRGPKLARLPCGGLAGACGPSVECQQALDWLRSPKGNRPKLGKDCWLLIAYGDGRVGLVIDKKWTFIPHTAPVAIGSGSQAAMAAMVRFKASALEAVQAAAETDPSTSGPFDVMSVSPKPKRKKGK